jgi:predicted nucleotidyltransferase
MNAETRASLAYGLQTIGLEVDKISAAGGGIWCFGSRACGCARPDSDWDVLVVRPFPEDRPRIRAAVLDVVQVCADALDAWSATELASHVACYGIRIDDGTAIKLRGIPHAAAAYKCDLLASRTRHLESVWAALQPVQRDYRALRLRRDLQRATLLAGGIAVPPTAWLDAEWNAATPAARSSVLKGVPRRIAHAIAALGESDTKVSTRDACRAAVSRSAQRAQPLRAAWPSASLSNVGSR